MNKKLLFLMPLIGAMSLAGCDKKKEESCHHADANNDFICDVCGVTLATTDVSLDTSNVQTIFALNDEFNADGLKVVATSEVGSKKELTFTTSTPDMSTVGDKSVEVTYGTGENDKKSYSINVSYWTAEDLAVLGKETALGYFASTPLPFVPGFNMRVEAEYEEEELESWKIVADHITPAGFLEVYNAYKDFTKVVELKTSVTFDFVETAIPEGRENFHDLTDLSLFRLAVTYFDAQEEVTVRYLTGDEYYVMGVNADGQMVIEVRTINAMLDGMFGGAKLLNGRICFPAQYNSYVKYMADPIGDYYSEVAYDSYVYPELIEEVDFFPINYGSVDPLDESLDEYEMAVGAVFMSGDEDVETTALPSQEESYNSFVSALLAAGYEAEEPEDPNGYTTYVLESEFVGKLEYLPLYSSQTNVFKFELYYTAPEKYEYVTRMHPGVVEFMGDLEVTDFEIDDSYYEEGTNEELDVWFEVTAPTPIEADEEQHIEAQSSKEQVLASLVSAIRALGYEVTSGPKTDEQVYPGGLIVELTDYSNFDLKVVVYEAKEGKCKVLIEFRKYYSFEIEDVLAAIFGEAAPTLKDGVYSIEKEGTMMGILDIANGEISNISSIDADGGIFVKDGKYVFSGVTKDGKISYSVSVSNAETAGNIVIEVTVAELGEKELLVRSFLSFFTSNGPVRNVNYTVGENGSASTTMYFIPAFEETFINTYFEPVLLPEEFVKTSTDPSGNYVYSNGSIQITVTITDDGEKTTVSILVVDLPVAP